MLYWLIKINRIADEKNAISMHVVDDQTWEGLWHLQESNNSGVYLINQKKNKDT